MLGSTKALQSPGLASAELRGRRPRMRTVPLGPFLRATEDTLRGAIEGLGFMYWGVEDVLGLRF